MKRSTISANWKRLAVIFFWIAAWQCISILVAQELLVPAPLVVLKTLVKLVQTTDFWFSSLLSLLRIVVGFLLAVVVGMFLAVCMKRSRILSLLVAPLVKFCSTVPVASFIILALVWIETEQLPSFISFFMVIPIVTENIKKGLKETDVQLLEMAQIYRMGKWYTLRYVWIPSVMPYFLTACTTGLGIAWKSGVAAEVICRPEFSIGKQLQNAKIYLETSEVFAWTIVIIILSLVLEKLLVTGTEKLSKRYQPGR